MNRSPVAVRPTAAVVAQILIWAWLIALSILVGLSYRAMVDLAEREQVDAGLRQVQVLEGRLAELIDNLQALQERPQPASAATLQDMRQSLEARIAQIEQVQDSRASTQALQTLRDEVEQLKSRQAAARPSAPQPTRTARPAAAAPREEQFPFRVVGVELRAGQRTLSVAPASGELSATQIQVVLPGEAVGQWRLEAIDGDTAVFRAGEQVRRLVIP